jgi:DNA-binding MarR family transcriptional regulator
MRLHIPSMPPRDLLHPEACLNANLRRANRRVSQWYARTIGDIGLEGTQFTLLATVNGFGSCTLGQLAQWMGLEQSTATRSVELLRKAGLVEVRSSERDARVREIALTAEGRSRLKEAMPAWRAAQEKAVSALGKAKATRLLAALQEIEDVLGE